jgi:putative transposase
MDDQERQYASRELFSNSLSKAVLHDIREALNQELVLGREDFKDKIEILTKRQTRPGKAGRPGVEESNVVYYAY